MMTKELKKNESFADFIKNRKRNKKISLNKFSIVAEHFLSDVEEDISIDDEKKLNLLLQYHNKPYYIKIVDVELDNFLKLLLNNKKKIDKILSFLIENVIDTNLKYILIIFLKNEPFVCIMNKLPNDYSFKVEFNYKDYSFVIVRLKEYEK